VSDEQVRLAGVEVHVDDEGGRDVSGAAAESVSHPLARVADELLPALVARLGVSGLGEIEVRQGDWRVRLRREASTGRSRAAASSAATEASRSQAFPRQQPQKGMVTAPAVGYYSPRDGLRVGQLVTAGDVFGWVDVLGVGQDVVAPISGTVGRRLVEPGQAVEYGQELLQIDPAGQEAATEAATAPEPEAELVAARAAD
jgi:biotin carboxyl carrier protein